MLENWLIYGKTAAVILPAICGIFAFLVALVLHRESSGQSAKYCSLYGGAMLTAAALIWAAQQTKEAVAALFCIAVIGIGVLILNQRHWVQLVSGAGIIAIATITILYS